MRNLTAGLGVLTALLASTLATPPGQVLFGPRTAFPGPTLAVIQDGPPAPAQEIAKPVRTIPTVRMTPGVGWSEPAPFRSPSGTEESQQGLEQIARIANILLNLSGSPLPQTHSTETSQGEEP